MKVLITRPEVDAAEFADLVTKLGHEAMLAPMMEMRFGEADLGSVASVTHLAFTSANGVRAWLNLSNRPDIPGGLPAFVIGPATARLAQAAGMEIAGEAASTVESMAEMIASKLGPQAGKQAHTAHLWHIGGTHQAGNLVGLLKAAGVRAEKKVLYEAIKIATLPEEIVGDLRAGQIAAATFFSPRTAKLFLEHVAHYQLGECLPALAVHCLSQPIADIFEKVAVREMCVAKSPNLAAMIDILKSDRT